MKTNHKIIVWFSGTALLVALGITLSLWTYRQIEEAAAVRKHTHTVIDRAEQLLFNLVEAETGQRGYLLTGDEASLAPYLAVRDSIRPSLDKLRQTTLLGAAHTHLEALVPLIDSRLARMAQIIALRRNHGLAEIQAQLGSGEGRRLTEAIHVEMRRFIQLQQTLLAQREAEFQDSMSHLFVLIVISSLLTFLFAMAFTYLIYRETQQRLKNLVHIKTQHLLENQEEKNRELQQANLTLRCHEEALAAKNAELVTARIAAETANRAKSDFLASMSHELRTPLNAVLGFAQLMEAAKTPPTSAQQQSIKQILKAGWHLLGLINEVLDLAKIESGRTTLSHDSMPLAEVLADCQAMLTPLAQQKEIRLIFPSSEHVGHVLGDAAAVKQVVTNLLSNAIKYNRFGGSVIVRCTASGERRLRISVEDSGDGLAPQQLAQLFQPFNRLGKEGGAEDGSGIGLVIAKQLVELMGGAIGVSSEVGRGSLFWFELVAADAPAALPGSLGKVHSEPPEDAAAQAFSALRTLLYVEDNPASLALVEQLIALRDDLKLLTATDGHLGIQLAHQHQPDVILMDINLPGINGLGALKLLRANPLTAGIPVVALSAKAMSHDIERGIEAGFFRYLTKPIKVDDLMATLDSALRYRQPPLPAATLN